ncbi:MAG: GNAT family N-acetyltransferase [Ilumatobacteraceae bacterium]
MTEIDIREVAEHERRAAANTLRAALLSGPVNDEDFERSQPSWDSSDAIAAWDGDACVGHVAAFRFDSTVPGGAIVPTAAVTRVGVLPTHTRRGLLTRLMHRLLAEARERGQVIATLHASETPIYQRYGFGLGTNAVAAVVTSRAATPWRTPPTSGSMRLLPYTEVLTAVPELYERVARERVGSMSRPDWWFRRVFKDASEPTSTLHGKGSFVAVHSDPNGNDDGYVFYEVDWSDGFAEMPAGAGKIIDLWGTSPEVELALWRYVLDIDLITEWKCEPRPVDEPVRRVMRDSRGYETRAHFDDQWVRLLDVDAALRERRFGPTLRDVSIRVTDPMFADNCGCWTITSGAAIRTDGAFDVAVDIATLSAAYLGAVSWHELAASGAVPGADTDLLTVLDTAFTVRPTPFCGTGY